MPRYESDAVSSQARLVARANRCHVMEVLLRSHGLRRFLPHIHNLCGFAETDGGIYLVLIGDQYFIIFVFYNSF